MAAKKVHVSVYPYGIAAEEIEKLCEDLGFGVSNNLTNATTGDSRIVSAIAGVEYCDTIIAVQTEKDLDTETALKVGYALALGKVTILFNLSSYPASPIFNEAMYEVGSHGALISSLKALLPDGQDQDE